MASVGSWVGEVLDRLAGIDGRIAAAALVLHVANHALRSVAWRSIVAAAYPDHRVPLTRVAAAYASGVALNAVAPARGGDAVKVALLRLGLPGSSLTTIASTMSVLVLFDLVAATVLTLAAGLAGVLPLDPAVPNVSATTALAGAAVAVVVLALAWRLVRPRLASLWADVRRGGAILRVPRRYALAVVLPQAGAWCCRVGVVLCLLAAFGLPASVPLAAVVMILTGASTLVPLTPGGAGTQQVVLAFALSETASSAAVVSFSLGMQAGVTVVNALLGVVAAMAIFRTTHPLLALRTARGLLARP
jgi:uncharacterized membrane protein YbhN (UPF0104 family)